MSKPSWIPVPDTSDFTLYNLPFGIFRTNKKSARAASRIGDTVIDLYELFLAGLLNVPGLNKDTLNKEYLNDFISAGKLVTHAVRMRLQELFSKENIQLRNNEALHSKILIPLKETEMMLPVRIGDYTDFYSSKHHASNVGSMFRDPENALLPNWKHLPVAYHGRSSSIVVSGTAARRPKGQVKPADAAKPSFGPTQALDFELEMAFVIGKDSTLGETISVSKAEEYIFGFLLFNDWSARDIQNWEYVPLGPFLSKNFLSSVSAWIVTLEALEPFRVQGPEPEEELLPYLQSKGAKNFDVQLEVYLTPEGAKEEKIVGSNFKYMYWNICQQLAHHTINGCNVRVGDLMASGTISGPEKSSRGCMLELTWRGKEPLKLANGKERKFLEDGDTVTFKGFAEKNGMRVGFGEVSGKIIP